MTELHLSLADGPENRTRPPRRDCAARRGGTAGQAGLDWADVDLATRRVHVRQAQVDDVVDDTKCEHSERIITLDKDRAESLKAWRKTQLAERLAWGAEWTDSGRVCTRRTGRRSGPPGSASGSTRSPGGPGFPR